MSSAISPALLQNQKTYACADADGNLVNRMAPVSERGLFTHQTGQLLATLGCMFVNLPTFNTIISPGTGELLISVGKKLKESAR